MTKLFYCLLLLCSCGTNTAIKMNNNIDSIFKAWNIATSSSIGLSISLANNEQERLLYENRLKAFKSYLQIKKFEDIETNSIRYKLLSQKEKSWGEKFYIIEANESGEQISLISYIINVDENSSKVLKYEFKSEKWTKTNEYAISGKFEYNKKDYQTEFGKGANQDDIIVTYIKNDIVIDSDYFLFSSMKYLSLK